MAGGRKKEEEIASPSETQSSSNAKVSKENPKSSGSGDKGKSKTKSCTEDMSQGQGGPARQYSMKEYTDAISKVLGEGIKNLSDKMDTSLQTMNANVVSMKDSISSWVDHPTDIAYEYEQYDEDYPGHYDNEEAMQVDQIQNEAPNMAAPMDGSVQQIGETSPSVLPAASGSSASLGHSQINQMNTIGDQTTVTAKDRFMNSLTTSKIEEAVGDPLDNQLLATKISALMREKPQEEFESAGLKKILRPENCPGLSQIKVNENIWNRLSKQAQSQDLGMQRVQVPLAKGASEVARLTDILLFCFDDSTGAISLDKQQTDTVLGHVHNAFGCLGAANFEFSQRRKELLKTEINNEFAHLCAQKHPYTELLFGDNISNTVEELCSVNKLSNKIIKPIQRGRGKRSFHPYSRGRGYSGQNQQYNYKWQNQGYYYRGNRGRGGRGRGRGYAYNGPFLGHQPRQGQGNYNQMPNQQHKEAKKQ